MPNNVSIMVIAVRLTTKTIPRALRGNFYKYNQKTLMLTMALTGSK
jgi:hypothetical protein